MVTTYEGNSMTLSPEILTAIKASCAAKRKEMSEVSTVVVSHPNGAPPHLEAGAQGAGAHKSLDLGHKSIHKFQSQSQANKFHSTVTGQGHTATVQHESKIEVAQYFKWLVDAPAREESAELEEALQNPEFMREAVKTRESTCLCLTLARKGEAIPEGLVIEAAIEAKAFGYTGAFTSVVEALQAVQQIPSRFAYMVLSALTENDAIRKNFLDMEMKDGVTLFYFTKPTAADKLKLEAERVLAPFGTVECLVSPGDVIGEGETSDLFVFAVTPTKEQNESIIDILVDGLVEAAIADSFTDISDQSLLGLINEAIVFLNQQPAEGDGHAEPDGDEDEEGKEPAGEEEDDKDSKESDDKSDSDDDGDEDDTSDEKDPSKKPEADAK
jgi:hypothetical protein